MVVLAVKCSVACVAYEVPLLSPVYHCSRCWSGDTAASDHHSPPSTQSLSQQPLPRRTTLLPCPLSAPITAPSPSSACSACLVD